jgi:hypothetical protein
MIFLSLTRTCILQRYTAVDGAVKSRGFIHFVVNNIRGGCGSTRLRVAAGIVVRTRDPPYSLHDLAARGPTCFHLVFFFWRDRRGWQKIENDMDPRNLPSHTHTHTHTHTRMHVCTYALHRPIPAGVTEEIKSSFLHNANGFTRIVYTTRYAQPPPIHYICYIPALRVRV